MKVIYALCLAIGIVGLVACDGSKSPTPPAPTPTTETAPAPTPTTTPTAPPAS